MVGLASINLYAVLRISILTRKTDANLATTQDSGMTLTYSFCDHCGCVISKIGDAEAFKGVVLIVAGSLDDKYNIDDAEPGVEFYVSKRASWLPALEGKGQMKEFS
jgi:hypothetical protein